MEMVKEIKYSVPLEWNRRPTNKVVPKTNQILWNDDRIVEEEKDKTKCFEWKNVKGEKGEIKDFYLLNLSTKQLKEKKQRLQQ